MGNKSKKKNRKKQPVPSETESTNSRDQGVHSSTTSSSQTVSVSDSIKNWEGQPNATTGSPLEQTRSTPTEEKRTDQQTSLLETEERGGDQVSRAGVAEFGGGPLDHFKEDIPRSVDEKVKEGEIELREETDEKAAEVLPKYLTFKKSNELLPNGDQSRKKENIPVKGKSYIRTAADIITTAVLFVAHTIDGIVADGLDQVDQVIASQRRQFFHLLATLNDKVQSVVLGALHRAYALQLRIRESSVQAIVGTRNTVVNGYLDPAKHMVESVGIKVGNVVEAEVENWTGNVGLSAKVDAERNAATTDAPYTDSDGIRRQQIGRTN